MRDSMKRNTVFFLFYLLIIIFLPIKVNAECSVVDKQNFLIQANQITYKYKYISGDDKFEVVLNNINEDLMVINDIGFEFKNGEQTGLTYDAGSSRRFSIMTKSDSSCPYEIIKDITVKLPIYNSFYENEKCKKEEYKDFKYCIHLRIMVFFPHFCRVRIFGNGFFV